MISIQFYKVIITYLQYCVRIIEIAFQLTWNIDQHNGHYQYNSTHDSIDMTH